MTDSKMHPNLLGQGSPPKVRQRSMRRKQNLLMDAWERDLEAVLEFKWLPFVG